jgi:hypothetical protein
MIHILDALDTRPGFLPEVQQRMQDRYRPLVGEFGMELAHVWMAPAVELRSRPTELLFLWELADVPAYWRMRLSAARDPRVDEFWRELEPLLAKRTRRLMCHPDDPTVLR